MESVHCSSTDMLHDHCEFPCEGDRTFKQTTKPHSTYWAGPGVLSSPGTLIVVYVTLSPTRFSCIWGLGTNSIVSLVAHPYSQFYITHPPFSYSLTITFFYRPPGFPPHPIARIAIGTSFCATRVVYLQLVLMRCIEKHYISQISNAELNSNSDKLG